MRGLLRSLILISMTIVFGWFATNFIRFGAEFLHYKTGPRIGLDLFAGIFVHISLAVNFFIYYFVSTDYREVFDKRLRLKILKQRLGIATASRSTQVRLVLFFER
ncbi:unnamed protein product [Strongylus vulgaris]|uniref:Uncharacterized protein n=1 Tax=Strongylus vulgaris TaxID=40348 RepID=A0A3P7IL58_STRVU|nr:unnamed protein product [Strongylus vulgaris]